MKAQTERVLVGLFVLLATGLLIVTLLSLGGLFERNEPWYRANFKNAGGLHPGSEVRYAGGPTVGRVTSVQTDPWNPALMRIDFRVSRDVPVKTDSRVKIASLSALGDNFLGIIPGTAAAPRAPSGTVLVSENYMGFDELEEQISKLTPQATELLGTLNARATELQVTIQRLNSLLSPGNRANLAATLANANSMLAEDRPPLHSALSHLSESSEKLGPLLDEFKKSVAQANTALSHVDAIATENRPDLRQAVVQMREALTSAAALTDQLNETLDANSDNLSVIIENVRDITASLKAFSQTIESRPSSLIRASAPREHVPGQISKHR
ncbi:MAG: MCE family protein, partial [Acidobacteriota bacterium]|nr:MCE family protein [Acidobacteriota bacterium]